MYRLLIQYAVHVLDLYVLGQYAESLLVEYIQVESLPVEYIHAESLPVESLHVGVINLSPWVGLGHGETCAPGNLKL